MRMRKFILWTTLAASVGVLAACGFDLPPAPGATDGGSTQTFPSVFVRLLSFMFVYTSDTTEPFVLDDIQFTFPDENDETAFDELLPPG